MRSTLFILALTPLLGGCLGPAPWADWDKGYSVSSSQPSSTSTWSDWGQGAEPSAVADDRSYMPAEDVSYGPRPEVQMLTAEPITAPPATRTQQSAGVESMGGPYAPLDTDDALDRGNPAQPLRLRGSESVRTLPLVMTGTGEKAP